ncbi:MAG: MarR family winged helix-turn-helix transcriptional regulator [Amnibacterium sp.]
MEEREPQAPRTAQPETAALRILQVAMGDAQQALGHRMRMIPTDLAAMAHLSSSGEPLGPTDLAGRLGLSPGATTELVDRLERAGHLLRQRDLADRRRVRLVPSPSARDEVLGRLGSLLDALDAIANDFSDEDRDVIRDYLDRVIAAYREYAGEEG